MWGEQRRRRGQEDHGGRHTVVKAYMLDLGTYASQPSSEENKKHTLMSSTARASEDPKPIAPHTRFHAWARGRSGSPCAFAWRHANAGGKYIGHFQIFPYAALSDFPMRHFQISL